jgi:hypothetical protein
MADAKETAAGVAGGVTRACRRHLTSPNDLEFWVSDEYLGAIFLWLSHASGGFCGGVAASKINIIRK